MTDADYWKTRGVDLWEERRKEHERAESFCAAVKSGDTVRITRYAFPEYHPFICNRHADIHDTRTVTVFAVDKAGLWFTTGRGEAIDATTLLSWEEIPKQGELF